MHREESKTTNPILGKRTQSWGAAPAAAGRSQLTLLPLPMAVELGEVDLYAYLLGGAALSCLIAVQWWTPWALLLLCCWYLRYAGLRPTACAGPPSAPPAARAANAPAVLGRPEARLCSTPPMILVAGAGCVCAAPLPPTPHTPHPLQRAAEPLNSGAGGRTWTPAA